jgi:hypothetical protein
VGILITARMHTAILISIFANRRVTTAGPFIFKCKFIAGANAADQDLLSAIRKRSRK